MYNVPKQFTWPPFQKVATLLTSVTLLTACGNSNKVMENVPVEESNPSLDREKMNIAYIVLDDSGYSDLSSFGSEIQSPHTDWLAENGLRYNNFHVTPTCSPTRSALLTGRQSHEFGMGTVANFDLGPDFPNKRGRIQPEFATIAEILKEEDYNNYALGKWHLSPSHHATPAGPYENWPLGKGFDRFYGFLEDSTDQMKPELVNDNTFIDVPDESDYHFSEAMVDQANQYITDHVSIDPDKPFFVTLNFGAQHQPIQVPEEYIQMYEGEYDEGWDSIRKKRFDKQIEIGILPKKAEFINRNPGVKAWNALTEEERKTYARFQEAYAGSITYTDEQIGRFMDHLRAVGELENTLIIVMSDDGASGLGGENGAINHTLTYNAIPQSKEEVMQAYDLIGSEHVKAEFPSGWAQVSNTPFKMYKSTTFEGGLRAPLIVYHPSLIKDKGEIREQYVHVSDITPTVLDLLGVELPEKIKGIKQEPLTGESFKQSLTNPKAEGKKTQYYEHLGQRAIYHDGWKAIGIHQNGEDYDKDVWELYHVAEDMTEHKNVARDNVKKLKELQELFNTEAEKFNVFPMSDLGLGGFLSVPEDSNRAKSRFTFYPGMSHLPEGAAPFTINKSYSIQVPVVRENSADEGVLVALGDFQSGYTFYIQNNKLVYEYILGTKVYKVESSEEVPVGNSVVEMQFKKTGNYQGTVSLSIDGRQVAEGEIEKTHPLKLSFEGLDIGQDNLNPVSQAYEGKFKFSGTIEKVVFELEEAH
ncbi:arylsulfatase [Sporosarcina soli]|uniref:Arylsulfatase n=1 Tax=Sporosarcina soli TaxID=334736 RepID=A0ABW0TK48_9BACL